MEFKFELGQIAKDTITGFSGVVVARSQWLNSCNTYSLQSQDLVEGKPIDRQHFDEPQLALVSEQQFKRAGETGGPAQAPPQTRTM
jgi:heat shock protein HspQ